MSVKLRVCYCKVSFLMTLPVKMTSQLLFAVAGSQVDCSQYVLQQRQPADCVVFVIRLPRAGLYKFQVHVIDNHCLILSVVRSTDNGKNARLTRSQAVARIADHTALQQIVISDCC